MLDGKRVVVTGAGRGIGRDIALGFARAGASVVISARTLPDLEEVAAAVRDTGTTVRPVTCDVTDPAEVVALQEAAVKTLGGVDILVNNAGVSGSHKFLTHPDELWHRMLNVNLTGVYYVTKQFAPLMVEQQWGRIINIASIAGKVGGKYIAAYTASKHGVLGLTRALAVELAPHVTVNAICPGYVETPMTDRTIANVSAKTGMTADQARALLERDNLQRRLIQPEEITALALHLARDESRGITGQAINIDAGAVMF